jgi:NADP-dependent 3-hydroxy acid dehydrogenase YdfG
MQLAGKIILVTGASAGIGESIAAVLTDEGATVVGWGEEVGSDAQLAAGIAHLSRTHGRLDALVNAALLDRRGPIADANAGDFRALVEANFIGPMLLNFAALPLLQAARGHIFNVSLLDARDARAGAGAFAATTGALAAYTESLRKDMATHGIRVTSVIAESDTVGAGDAIADALAHPPHAVVNELVVRNLEVRV